MSAQAGEPGAFFTVDGDNLIPGPMAQGPWGDTVGGHIVGGLLGWAVEQAIADPDLQPARLTVDLLRPTMMAPLQVRSEVVREGKRIAVVDAEVVQGGTVVSRATSVFLRRSEHPDGTVWTAPTSTPPLPDPTTITADEMPFAIWAYGRDPETGTPGGTSVEWQQGHARKFAWIRELRPLIAGQPTSQFTRAVLAADVTSALTHWSSTGLRYINADFTLSLSRLPVGEFIGLGSDSHFGADGVGVGSATVFDERGPIGSSIAVALAQPADAFRPPPHIGLR